MAQLKEIIGWDDGKDRFDPAEIGWLRHSGPLDRPNFATLNVRYGSYRKLPASVSIVSFRSLLNLTLFS